MSSNTAFGTATWRFASFCTRPVLSAAFILILSGCTDQRPHPEDRTESGHARETNGTRGPDLAPATGQPAPVASEKTVALERIDEAGLARAVENHRGHVVLVDFWATWYLPCVKMLPHTVALQRDQGKRGLDVITVSMDDPDEEAGVRRILEQDGAVTENYLNRYQGSSEAVEHFQLPGALPHVRIYDRTGKIRQTFPIANKPFSPEDIDRVVEGLLGSQENG